MASDAAPAIVSDETAPLARGNTEETCHLTSLTQTVFNMINCFIGAGILTIPFAFRLGGYGAVFGLAFVCALNWYTALLLGRALENAAALNPEVPSRSWDMGALGKAAFGVAGDRCIRMLFAVELWFALETFLVLTGISANLLTGIPEAVVIILAGTIGCFSLALPMTTLSKASFLALACMVGGLVALIICGLGRLWDHSPDVVLTAEQHHAIQLQRMPASLGMFLYCFSGLPCLPSIRASMQKPKEEYAKAVHISFAYAFAYYLAVGLLGYHFFANDTRRSFLKDLVPLPGEGHSRIYGYVSSTAAGLFALKLQAGFPLYAGPILGAIGLDANDQVPSRSLWLGRSLFCAVSVAFAVFARNQIDSIAELMGAFLTNATSIMFPVAAYWSLANARGQKKGKTQAAGLSALLLFGAVYGVVGTVSAFRNFWYGTAIHVGGGSAGYMPVTNLTKVSLMRAGI